MRAIRKKAGVIKAAKDKPIINKTKIAKRAVVGERSPGPEDDFFTGMETVPFDIDEVI